MKIDIYIYGDQFTPSSRLRWINYKNEFENENIDFKVKEIGDYVSKRFFLKKPIEQADVIVIQKYILSDRLLNKFKSKCEHIVFDIDDAIWLSHSYKKKNQPYYKRLRSNVYNVMFYESSKKYDKIISSNNYIKDFLEKLNKNITIIPTSPSDNPNKNQEKKLFDGKFIVGWTGTKANFVFIHKIEKYFREFFIKNKNAYLLIVSDGIYESDNKEFNKKIINVKWDVNSEIQYIKSFDIGIMPLEKDEWCLGKAAYKLIYYMKNGIPTISTNWGFQTEFINNGQNGYLVENNKAWERCLQLLYDNSDERPHIGNNGYNTYLKLFSKEVIFTKMKDALVVKSIQK
ncbi:glycosyltransferase [Guptibacillus hwajinpoensis]|uniref:glycosyltransferase n=1 Tax=Guptibacillus hwajinpoensis TaxID=208199 RepID=UPI00384C95B5